MAIVPINLVKNAITPTRVSKGGYAVWDDPIITWDSSTAFWDSPLASFTTNLTKHSITPTNQTKH